MTAIPEGAKTAEGEGRDLATAIKAVAESLGIEPTHVGYKLDMSHFRNATGASRAVQTVKIMGWEQEPAADRETIIAANANQSDAAPRREREDRGDREERPRRDREERPRRDRDDRPRGGREDRGAREERPRRDREERPRRDREERPRRDRDDRGDRGERAARAATVSVADLETNEASEFAKVWVEALLGHMDLTGNVSAGNDDGTIRIVVADLDKAGRLIGKRGSTLRSVRRILGIALEKKFDASDVELDIADDKPRAKSRDRDERRDRDDRDDRGGDRKRGRGRGRDGGRDRDRDRDDRRGGGGKFPEDKLRALARRASEKALETGKAVTINLELNSYDRRIVHLEVAEVDGVISQSEERDGNKVVQVVPELLES